MEPWLYFVQSPPGLHLINKADEGFSQSHSLDELSPLFAVFFSCSPVLFEYVLTLKVSWRKTMKIDFFSLKVEYCPILKGSNWIVYYHPFNFADGIEWFVKCLEYKIMSVFFSLQKYSIPEWRKGNCVSRIFSRPETWWCSGEQQSEICEKSFLWGMS